MTAHLLTYSGRLLTPDSGHPSLIDIAVGLSRQPRFGGQTTRWWSVLDHTLFCDELLQSRHRQYHGWGDLSSRYRLAVLLHDAHEALTGDIPSPLKTPGMKAVQAQLDERIFGAFYPGGYTAYLRSIVVPDAVRDIDHRALVAEAYAFVNPVGAMSVAQAFGDPNPEDGKALKQYLGEAHYAARPPERWGQYDHPAVQEYLYRMLTLM